MASSDTDRPRLDSAARAAWLYFIAGNTQEEIAQKLGVSRPTAQRLISFAVSERLITFRFRHPLASCMELAAKLTEKYGLKFCEIVPSDPTAPGSLAGVATSAAAFIEQVLSAAKPTVVALGTGRALRAAVDQMQPFAAPQHTLVALVGNIAPDGSASAYDVLGRLADLTGAHHYPIPMPVLADTPAERDLLVSLQTVQRVHALANSAEVVVVGVGQMDLQAQQLIDGFISRDELLAQMRSGSVGEITGWGFNAAGEVLTTGINPRITSAPLQSNSARLVVGVAVGAGKVGAINSALNGHLLSGLITDEATAEMLLHA